VKTRWQFKFIFHPPKRGSANPKKPHRHRRGGLFARFQRAPSLPFKRGSGWGKGPGAIFFRAQKLVGLLRKKRCGRACFILFDFQRGKHGGGWKRRGLWFLTTAGQLSFWGDG